MYLKVEYCWLKISNTSICELRKMTSYLATDVANVAEIDKNLRKLAQKTSITQKAKADPKRYLNISKSMVNCSNCQSFISGLIEAHTLFWKNVSISGCLFTFWLRGDNRIKHTKIGKIWLPYMKSNSFHHKYYIDLLCVLELCNCRALTRSRSTRKSKKVIAASLDDIPTRSTVLFQ